MNHSRKVHFKSSLHTPLLEGAKVLKIRFTVPMMEKVHYVTPPTADIMIPLKKFFWYSRTASLSSLPGPLLLRH